MPEKPNNNLVPHFSALFIGILVLISLVGGASFSFSQGAASLVAKNSASTTIVLPEPELSAHAYSVRVLGSPVPLLKRREWKKLAPASLTKLLSAFVAHQALAGEDTITLTEDAKNIGEKSSPAPAGESFSRDPALRFFLMESANDIGMAMAEEVGKRKEDAAYSERLQFFADLMNTAARQIGMADSSFKNPTGLDEEGHVATAQDLSRLIEFLWYNDRTLIDMTRERELEITSVRGNAYTAKNTNELLSEFPALLGGKTGFTDNARGALILLYPLRSASTSVVGIVILGSEDRFGDGRKIIQWLEKLD